MQTVEYSVGPKTGYVAKVSYSDTYPSRSSVDYSSTTSRPQTTVPPLPTENIDHNRVEVQTNANTGLAGFQDKDVTENTEQIVTFPTISTTVQISTTEPWVKTETLIAVNATGPTFSAFDDSNLFTENYDSFSSENAQENSTTILNNLLEVFASMQSSGMNDVTGDRLNFPPAPIFDMATTAGSLEDILNTFSGFDPNYPPPPAFIPEKNL